MKDAAHLESAYNGAEGIEAARRIRPDLILMDLRMPVMDGLDAIAHLKSDPETAAIPIVAVTAQAMVEDTERALAAGADGVVTKPVDVDQLTNELGRVVDVKV